MIKFTNMGAIMQYLDLTLASAAANLACDEALLDACEDGSGAEVLRFWQPEQCFVVAGYSNAVAREVNLAACRQAGLGVFRRCSGGGAVLQGPGCLNYALVLRIAGHAALASISGANRLIMERQRAALAGLLRRPVEVKGCTDLAVGGLKFSGNAQRRKRHALIFHGTFLLHLDLSLMDRFLHTPSRQPDYRAGRAHDRFLMNLDVAAPRVQEALREAWAAHSLLSEAPDCRRLIEEKYTRDDWNLKF
jgi:lipoate---protein ligase